MDMLATAKSKKYPTSLETYVGTDKKVTVKTAQEIADMVEGLQVVEEHSFNEEMKKYTIRAKLFAMIAPKMNNRWATFKWGGKMS